MDTEYGRSVTLNAGAAGRTLTEKVFNLRWSDHFPLKFENGWTVERSSFEECASFTSLHYDELFLGDQDSPFLWGDSTEARRRYYREAGDFFAFRDQNEIFGVFAGTLHDWSTYYLRHTLLLTEYQGHGFYQKFFNHIVGILDSKGVPRLEGEISPLNQKHLHIFMKAGFVVSGLNLTERWGSMLRLTRFLDSQRMDVFSKQFCHGKSNWLVEKGESK